MWTQARRLRWVEVVRYCSIFILVFSPIGANIFCIHWKLLIAVIWNIFVEKYLSLWNVQSLAVSNCYIKKKKKTSSAEHIFCPLWTLLRAMSSILSICQTLTFWSNILKCLFLFLGLFLGLFLFFPLFFWILIIKEASWRVSNICWLLGSNIVLV